MQEHAEPPLISDDLLTKLAAPEYQANLGEFTDQTRALLAMALPDICEELLQHRRANHANPNVLCLAMRPEAVTQSLEAARRLIRAPEPTHIRDLTIACQTLLMHSRDATERNCAADVLAQIGEAA